MVITACRRAGNAAQVAPGEESRESMLEVLRRDQTPASLCPLTMAALGNVLLAQAGPRGQPCWQHRTGGHVLEQVAWLRARVCAHACVRPVACGSCQFSVLSAFLGQVEHMYCRAVGEKGKAARKDRCTESLHPEVSMKQIQGPHPSFLPFVRHGCLSSAIARAQVRVSRSRRHSTALEWTVRVQALAPP